MSEAIDEVKILGSLPRPEPQGPLLIGRTRDGRVAFYGRCGAEQVEALFRPIQLADALSVAERYAAGEARIVTNAKAPLVMACALLTMELLLTRAPDGYEGQPADAAGVVV
jgi:hypothetical protein